MIESGYEPDATVGSNLALGSNPMMSRGETTDSSIAYRQRVEDVIAALGSDGQRGLSEDAARSRLERYGANELASERAVPAWRRFLRQFQDVLVILLLIATAISAGLWAFERNDAWPYEAIAIFSVVLLNAAPGYVQESRAEAAIAALRAMSAARAVVIRGGSGGAFPQPTSCPATSFSLRKETRSQPTRA